MFYLRFGGACRDALGLVYLADPKVFEEGSKKADNVTVDRTLDHEDHGPPFLLSEHNLGIAFWCIPLLLQHVYPAFHKEIKVLGTSIKFSGGAMQKYLNSD